MSKLNYNKKTSTMKKLLISILLILTLNNSSAAADQTCDTLAVNTYHYTYIDTSAPLNIHILEVDLTNPNIKVVSQLANSQIFGRKTVSQMAQKMKLQKNKEVLAAINGDFFEEDGRPVGAQIVDRQLVKIPTYRSTFGLTESRRPIIYIIDFNGRLFIDENEIAIDRINLVQKQDQLILYNKFRADSTPESGFICHISAQYINDPVVNDTSYLIVQNKWVQTQAPVPIPDDGILLSARKNKAQFLKKHIAVRDTIKMLLSLPPIKDEVRELVGGIPRIIKNGKIHIQYEEEGLPKSFSTTRHPRTAIGFNRSGTRLYFFTVDGRQEGHSRGMSLPELANFMLDWGVYEGLNLDGGGSTTMYIKNRVVNSPSDKTGERPVANALMILNIKTE